MPSVRNLLKRLRTVKNIRTITKTMEMAAAARLFRSNQRLRASEPVAAEVARMLEVVLRLLGPGGHPLLAPGRGDIRALLVLTSDRGLCGGYNNQIGHRARHWIDQLQAEGQAPRVSVIGRKGAVLLRSWAAARGLSGALSVQTVREDDAAAGCGELAAQLAREFVAGGLASVEVCHMGAPARGLGRVRVETLLPLTVERLPAQSLAPEPPPPVYDFVPDVRAAMEALLPLTLRLRLLNMMLQAFVSEHTARLMAMHAATTNADDMIRTLTRRANRARQGRITSELAEIVSGAESLR